MRGKRDMANAGRSRTEGHVVAVHKLALSGELRLGKTLCVNRDGREILLCRTAAGVFAVDNECTHAAARLCEGRLRGNSIICPLHGAAFDVRDGTALTRPARDRLRVYPVRVDGEDVLIEIAE
jgi:3-phenylpropionate/trans-cinnamate dioxygenase ferredoxin subunit